MESGLNMSMTSVVHKPVTSTSLRNLFVHMATESVHRSPESVCTQAYGICLCTGLRNLFLYRSTASVCAQAYGIFF